MLERIRSPRENAKENPYEKAQGISWGTHKGSCWGTHGVTHIEGKEEETHGGCVMERSVRKHEGRHRDRKANSRRSQSAWGESTGIVVVGRHRNEWGKVLEGTRQSRGECT